MSDTAITGPVVHQIQAAAQAAEIAQSAADILQPEVNQIKDDVKMLRDVEPLAEVELITN